MTTIKPTHRGRLRGPGHLGKARESVSVSSGTIAELIAVVKQFIDTAEDYLPDGIDDPTYSPEAALLARAEAVIAKLRKAEGLVTTKKRG